MFAQSTFGPPPVRIRRVKKHLSTIADDDAFLVRENHGEWLNALELREALEERGMYVPSFTCPTHNSTNTHSSSVTEGLTTDAMRARLRWWLTQSTQPETDPIRKRLELIAANSIGKHD